MNGRGRGLALALALALAAGAGCSGGELTTGLVGDPPVVSSTSGTMGGQGEGEEEEEESEGVTTAAGTSTAGTTSTSAGSDPGSEAGGDDPLRWDLGDGGEFPASTCGEKIDFLFVISRGGNMAGWLPSMAAAFPKFIATIEEKFAGVDLQIMVAETTRVWGNPICNEECTPQGCDWIPYYPCHLMWKVTPCDHTLGAGVIFPAGGLSSNIPCPMPEGRRYLKGDDPDLAATFTCVAQLGYSGLGLLGEAMVEALKPEINAPDGCNAGFLRDDALLMVTFIGGYEIFSKGTPKSWAAALLEAKGDPRRIVLANIVRALPTCHVQDRICEMVKMFPYYLLWDIDDDLSAGFDAATDLIDVACTPQIPG